MESKNIKKEDKNNRKFVLLWVTLALVLILIIGGTYAWFLYSQQRTNKFSLGEIKHEIVENFKPTGASKDVLPGDIVNKDVWIHNTGKSDALLRVKITPVWIEGSTSTEITNKDVELVFPNDLAANWQKGKDGYYYYKAILKGHDSTKAHPNENTITNTNIPNCYSKQILDAVKLSTTLTEPNYANKNFDIVIISETIQVNEAAFKDQWKTSADKDVETTLSNLVNQYKIQKEKTHL